MGASPLTAMNIVCFSLDEFDESILKETLEGGLEKIHEAGAFLIGGHSVDDREFKYGLSVTGKIHPDNVITNCGGKTGDRLILTKAIGTGVLATAIKGKLADSTAIKNLVETASSLNKKACEIMVNFSPNACTDVTGFGLAGHLLEMAMGAHKEIILEASKVPFIDKAKEYASMGLIPAGSYKTKEWCGNRVSFGTGVEMVAADLLFDPQTSGGLIIALKPSDAKECLNMMKNEGVEAEIIAEVADNNECGHVKVI